MAEITMAEMKDRAAAATANQMAYMSQIFGVMNPDRLLTIAEAADMFKQRTEAECMELARGPNPSASTNINIQMDSRIAYICAQAFSAMAVQALYHRLKEDCPDDADGAN